VKFPIDLTEIESKKGWDGYRLQCPICGNWVSKLLISEMGNLFCRACWKRTQNIVSGV